MVASNSLSQVAREYRPKPTLVNLRRVNHTNYQNTFSVKMPLVMDFLNEKHKKLTIKVPDRFRFLEIPSD